jgi:uncharacterized membrane protein YphA (DoxX/SURF4 family)
MNINERISNSYWVLRIGLGLGAFLAGLDKFFNILANWEAYLSPAVTKLLPVSDVAFMRAVGVIEMIAGMIVLTGFARIGGYIVMAWLIAIAINLVITGHYFDLAVRDVEMALGAFVLARLAEVRETEIVHNPRMATA